MLSKQKASASSGRDELSATRSQFLKQCKKQRKLSRFSLVLRSIFSLPPSLYFRFPQMNKNKKFQNLRPKNRRTIMYRGKKNNDNNSNNVDTKDQKNPFQTTLQFKVVTP
ncbi:hypothetical protein CIPAW_07G005400 [Carya illinoinensis]|uniref:Uncharacterized protein n=1 Tax=Carya illinoinensis TaxID=32201 RepID=A0A8T1PX46_CARIL|nr:hypothetical protein CIPAW_07G005400 [Carya illinoinensis]